MLRRKVRNRLIFLGVFISLSLFSASSTSASNPVTPILPSDNIQDPGDPGTSWGGCGPSDSNCYVTITDSQWTTTGSDIYYSTGNVGIGTSTPSSLLDLKVSAVTSSVFSISNGGTKYFVVNARASNTNAIGTNAGLSATSASNSNFFGVSAGSGATSANNSNFLGNSSGSGATSASNSNFFGSNAGTSATGANDSNFFGYEAGRTATNASYANFIGFSAGYGASTADNGNFIGSQAGYLATGALLSNFIGYQAGREATNASSSNFIGYQAGKSFVGNNVGSNNIIIGTNVSLPDATTNAINIGGVLFGTGTYSTLGVDPSITPVSGGRIGIGTSTPASEFDVTATGLGTTQTNTDGILLANTTAATSGVTVQISPAIRWRGTAWSSDLVSKTYDFRAYVLPTGGGTNPTGTWKLQGSSNGAAYSDILTVASNGTVTSSGSFTAPQLFATSGGLQLTGTIYLNGIGVGSSGQALTSTGSSSTPTWTTLNSIATSGLSNGSGTTANGTAVDLGGALSSNANILLNSNNLTISGDDGAASGIEILAADKTTIGDWNNLENRNKIIIDDANNLAYYDNITSTGFFGVNISTPSVALDVTGDIEYTGDITDVSDERLKENITDFGSGLSIINSIGVKNYNMKVSPNKKETGFIAQNVQGVFPQAVSIVDPTNGYMGVSYVSFVPVLAKAIQELDLKIIGIENFDQENSSFGEKLRGWLANATNKITRIFTGEICLTDTDGTSECINKTQLGQLKQLINNSTGGGGNPTDILPVDVCPNIDGVQTSVPEGYNIDGENNCIQNDSVTPPLSDTPPEQPTDLPTQTGNPPTQ